MEPTSSPDNTRPQRGLARFWPVHRDDENETGTPDSGDMSIAHPSETEVVALGSREITESGPLSPGTPEGPSTPAASAAGGPRGPEGTPNEPQPGVSASSPPGSPASLDRSPDGPARDTDHSGPARPGDEPGAPLESSGASPWEQNTGSFGGFDLGGRNGRFLFGGRDTPPAPRGLNGHGAAELNGRTRDPAATASTVDGPETTEAATSTAEPAPKTDENGRDDMSGFPGSSPASEGIPPDAANVPGRRRDLGDAGDLLSGRRREPGDTPGATPQSPAPEPPRRQATGWASVPTTTNPVVSPTSAAPTSGKPASGNPAPGNLGTGSAASGSLDANSTASGGLAPGGLGSSGATSGGVAPGGLGSGGATSGGLDSNGSRSRGAASGNRTAGSAASAPAPVSGSAYGQPPTYVPALPDPDSGPVSGVPAPRGGALNPISPADPALGSPAAHRPPGEKEQTDASMLTAPGAAAFPADKVFPADKPFSAEKSFATDTAFPADKTFPTDTPFPAEKSFATDKAFPAEKSFATDTAFPAEKSFATDTAFPADKTFPTDTPFSAEKSFAAETSFAADTAFGTETRTAHEEDTAAPRTAAPAPRRSASLEDVEPVRRGRRAAPDPDDDFGDDGPLRPGDVAEGQISFWDDEATQHFRAAWHEVKAEFVDDPVTALTRAHDLLTDAVNELTEALLAERDELDPLRGTATPDTESMRMAMRGYREFLDRILAL